MNDIEETNGYGYEIGWLAALEEQIVQDARDYLVAHPDEPGVVVNPVVNVGDEQVTLPGVPFSRQDLGL